ncbi:MAG: hypothetical protein ONB32_13300 [candidate division KSB1 bacterium]|nr:hypothetical protein [candidate division KSB1 bacterium]MDZ7399692.1 hypothetical protein [candidate division KSB1 bacterium]
MTKPNTSKTKSIEEYVFYVAAGLSGLVSLLDLLGFLDAIPWLAAHIPTLTLLLVSILLGYMTSGIVNKLGVLESAVLDLRSYVHQETTEKIASLRSQLDPNLDVIFGEHISDLLTSVERAITRRTFEFHDIDLFRYFYKRTLEAYPRATFLATSLPYQRYFWKNQPMEQAMARFIAGGGKIKRVFFISRPEELDNDEVKEILSTQVKLGVETYVADARVTPAHLRRFFVVETKGRIAWEVFIGPDNRIVSVVATSEPTETEKYARMYKELLELDGTRRYFIESAPVKGKAA